MADSKVSALDTLGSVDRTTDLLYVVDASGPTSNKITINSALGISSGNPVSTTDSQTLQNKTLDNTTALTVKDNSFTIQDNSDTTKQLQLQLSGITTGTTRTLTIPDANTTLVGTDATQTLTNKTLTSPTINTATISNPTLTVDTISEHTSANGVNIDGLLIKDGLLPAGNIQPLNLVAGTSSSWAMQTWSPTFTGFSANPTGTYYYVQIGKVVIVSINMSAAGTSNTTTFSISAPVTARTISGAQWQSAGQGKDNGAGITTPVLVRINSGSSTINVFKDWTGTAWTASGDKQLLSATLIYEAA